MSVRTSSVFHLAVLLALLLTAGAQAQLRVVTYNTLDNPATTTDDSNLRTVFSAIAADSVNGIAKRADIIAVQEQTSTSTARIAQQLNIAHGVSSYVGLNTDGGTDQVAMVYDSATVQMINSIHVELGTRSAHRIQFRPVGYGPFADFYVYSMHLKAGTSGTDKTRRYNEVVALRQNADALGEGAHCIYAGDMNLYNSSEAAYGKFLSAGAGQGFDPINRPGSWHDSYSYRDIFTQSTRTTQFDGGASGGFDDRFDFQIVTNEWLDGEGLSYVGPTATGGPATHSYRAFGNDGNIFNGNINDPANTNPQNVLDALYYFSDHLPVVADYQLPAVMDVGVQQSDSTVITGAPASLNVTVSNAAAVVSVNGADELDYSINGSGVVAGSASGSDDALGGGAMHNIPLDTFTAGNKSGQLNVTSSSQAVHDGSFSQAVSLLVLDHSEGSFSTSADVDILNLDLGSFEPNSGVIDDAFGITNLASLAGFTADMDILSVLGTGDTGALFTNAAPATLGPDETLPCMASLDTAAGQGMVSAAWTFAVADESLPGATAGTDLVLTLSAYVAITGDVDLDKDVDLADLGILASHWGTTSGSWDLGDFDGDDDVDLTDLSLLASNFGTTLGMHMVPEPTALALLALGGLAMRRRRM